MNFSYSRTIRFADTDGAGVVYFAQILSICHEAYEASLEFHGVNLRSFFGNLAIAIPIVHAEANFRQPMFCGDRILVTLQTQQLSSDSYEIKYEIHNHEIHNHEINQENPPFPPESLPETPPESPPKSPPKSPLIAQAKTKHICINPQLRSRQELPNYIHQWLYGNSP